MYGSTQYGGLFQESRSAPSVVSHNQPLPVQSTLPEDTLPILPGLLCTGSNMAFDDELLELHFDNIDSHQTGGDCRHILP